MSSKPRPSHIAFSFSLLWLAAVPCGITSIYIRSTSSNLGILVGKVSLYNTVAPSSLLQEYSRRFLLSGYRSPLQE